jgi:prephenate dehydrogenase
MISEPLTVGIIGGTGRMGSWFAKFFERQGAKLLCAGRKSELTPVALAKQSDVVIVSVPIVDTERVIREVGPHVPGKSLFMDLTSTKNGPVEAMLGSSRAEVVGAHPLFGPDQDLHASCRIVLCPGRGRKWLNWLINIFKGGGLKVITLSPEIHDHQMGLIQGVNHFTMLALALCIYKSDNSLEKVMNVATSSFERQVARIRAILMQSPDLFASLLMDNPQAIPWIETFLERTEELIYICQRGDKDAFQDLFGRLGSFFLDKGAP